MRRVGADVCAASGMACTQMFDTRWHDLYDSGDIFTIHLWNGMVQEEREKSGVNWKTRNESLTLSA
jgi:hypothetical protein